jgi:hypothetical protein
MDMLTEKTTINVPLLYNCPLPIGHRLVLAYRLYKAKFQHDPSDLETHYHTGLSRATIKNIAAELAAEGWYTKFQDFTRPANNKDGYQWFHCFVHQPGQPQSVASIAVWSLLHHNGEGGVKKAYNYEYFRTALGLGNGTARNCLEALKRDLWLTYTPRETTGARQVLDFARYRLGESQLACLRNKGVMAEVVPSNNDLTDPPLLNAAEQSSNIDIIMEDTHVYNTLGSADPDSIESFLAYLSGVFKCESAYLAKIEASFRKRGVNRIARKDWKPLAEKFRASRV